MIRVLFSILVCLASLWAFDEDELLNDALNAVDAKQYVKARDLYLLLYDESGKLEYLRESILVSSIAEDPQGTIRLVKLFYSKNPAHDLEIEKVLADSYLRLGDVKNSIATIEKIKKQEDSPLVNEILGGLYMQSERFDEALKALNSAYGSTHSEASLEKMIAIYLNKEQSSLAFDLLNAHLQKYGCSQELCQKSMQFYVKTKRVGELEKILKKLYEQSPTIQNATNLIAVYAYQKKIDEAIAIAKKTPINRKVLLELYLEKKDYKSASALCDLIYKEERAPQYLIFAQIYYFELMKDRMNEKELASVVADLRKGILELKKKNFQDTALFAYLLNFAGYLMIDYKLGVEEGIAYVKEALKVEPNNVEYRDSLAWGYYRLGHCAKAKEEFAKIPKEEILKNQELVKHQKILSSCVAK